MHIAVIQGDIDIIKLLRDFVDLTIEDIAGNPPMAYCRDREEIRKVLVNPMLDILMRLAKGGFPGDEEKLAIEVLSEFKGVPGCLTRKEVVDVRDYDGSTPLLQAVIHGNRDLVSVLTELNADPCLTNTFGMDSVMWAKWTRNQRVLNVVRPDGYNLDCEQLARLEIAKRDAENAPLLFLGRVPEKYETFSVSGIKQRMELFLNTPTDCKTVPNLPMIENGNTNVASYFEQKDSGLEEIMSTRLVWNAKAFVINCVARGLDTVTPTDVMALSMYTNNPLVSRVLNTKILQRDLASVVGNYVDVLHKALRKLPAFQGEVFIGSADVDRKMFPKGREFIWQHFVTGSTMWRVALENCPQFTTKSRKGVIFIVKSKTGRLISRYCQFSFDSEVMFLPHTKFRVSNWYHGDVIALGQENIREHTFGVKERDDERMCLADLAESDKALIIELTET
jgi:hypothetical protein